jgi:hypothetical protein
MYWKRKINDEMEMMLELGATAAVSQHLVLRKRHRSSSIALFRAATLLS